MAAPHARHPHEQRQDYHDRSLAPLQPLNSDAADIFPSQFGSDPSLVSLLPQLASIEMNFLQCSEEQLVYLLWKMLEAQNLISALGLVPARVQSFLADLRRAYRHVPFHNFCHAFSVAQAAHSTLAGLGVAEALQMTPLERLAVLLASLIHDVDHPGLTNDFNIKTQSYLATLYNDTSVLENHHCAQGFFLIRKHQLLDSLPPAEQALLRKLVVGCVLATDLAVHRNTLAELKARSPDQAWASVEERGLLCKLIVKCADLNNELHPLEMRKVLAERVMEEFLTQGDLEKSLGLSPLPHLDRAKTGSLSKEQSGFIRFLCLPLFEEAARLVPQMAPYRQALQDSLAAHEAEVAKQVAAAQ
eukprot:gnl/Hemi2/24008_TR8051_c0_g1_i1.p1 gnl/Hemi2/24008_TR8051_c0_g1~~gnl/Hemi2/24008_TR8051_c0_g1_i1.p1  ORF type:complete len:359 (+),score=111.59 gnl/Hemi2/24008_TR8051_c0_g1_i1:171-1247(+)